MQINHRKEQRRRTRVRYAISWHGRNGETQSEQVLGLDLSTAGISFLCPVDLRLGANVFIEALDGHPNGYGKVRHCTRRDAQFVVGVEFDEETRKTMLPPGEGATDYYEYLQISPKAEPATIHRVYRFMAARFVLSLSLVFGFLI